MDAKELMDYKNALLEIKELKMKLEFVAKERDKLSEAGKKEPLTAKEIWNIIYDCLEKKVDDKGVTYALPFQKLSEQLYEKQLFFSSPQSEGKELSEWISVEERLPIDAQDVLTLDDTGECYVTFCTTKLKFKNHSGDKRIVTHWMPLPNPPKQK